MGHTTEYVNGAYVPKTLAFKRYSSADVSIADHTKVLQLPRYTKYFESAGSVEDFAVGLQKGGYATDPAYAYNLVNVIKKNNLTQYDTGKYKLVNTAQLSRKDSGASVGNGNADFKTDMLGDHSWIMTIMNKGFYGIVLVITALVAVVFFMRAFDISPPTLNLSSIKGGITE